jgi:hypothetical protein|tara:strand:+ start:64 stop:318 length:255 start_codon:yes stop_codon:yes gene_type:complete
MAKCLLCENALNEYWFANFCSNCRKIKHFLSLYHDRVYEVLDSVLSRTEEKQENKIKVEIKEEIENKQTKLRSGKNLDKSYISK